MALAADSTVNCPLCEGQMPITRLAADRASYFTCAACDAWWFDAGQLGAYLSTSLSPCPPNAVPGEGGGRLAPRQRRLPCPRCDGNHLRSFQFRTFDFEHCPQCGGTFAKREGVRALAEERVERKSGGAGEVALDALGSGYAGIGASMRWMSHEAAAIVPPNADGVAELRPSAAYTVSGWLATIMAILVMASYWLVDWEDGTRWYQVALLAAVFLVPGLLIFLHTQRTRVYVSPNGVVQRRMFGKPRAIRWDQLRDVSLSWWTLSPVLVLDGSRGERIALSYGYVGFMTLLDHLTPYATTDNARRALDRMRGTIGIRTP